MPCCTNGMNGYSGLGQFDPATIAAVQEAFVHAKDLWNNLMKIFGIGAGAKEADAIVPLQNQMLAQILAPVSDFLTAVHNGTINPSCGEVQTWQTQLNTHKAKWLEFLHGTKWADGRAAQQAEATLAPYWNNATTDLQTLAKSKCGIVGGGGSIGGILTTANGEMNWPIIAVAAGALFMMSRRK